MKNIDILEHGGGHFAVLHRGEIVTLPDPRTKHYQWILMVLGLGWVPGTPQDIPAWQARHVFDRWCAAWDLPDFQQSRRLAYLVDHYRSSLAYDLQTFAAGADLGDLWRSRHWRTLLDLVDHLPGHSWYSASVADDEEHAKMMAESLASRKSEGEEDKASGPKLTSWTPEVATLTNVLDAVRHVSWAVFAAQAGAKAGEAPRPVARPTTALERALKRAEYDRRMKSHESLVARMLPHKADKAG